jgi:hypothetical protein
MGMVGYGRVYSAKWLRLAIVREDGDEILRILGSIDPGWLTVARPELVAAFLDGLAALEDRDRIEAEAPRWLLPNAYVAPFAVRALGIARPTLGCWPMRSPGSARWVSTGTPGPRDCSHRPASADDWRRRPGHLVRSRLVPQAPATSSRASHRIDGPAGLRRGPEPGRAASRGRMEVGAGRYPPPRRIPACRRSSSFPEPGTRQPRWSRWSSHWGRPATR